MQDILIHSDDVGVLFDSDHFLISFSILFDSAMCPSKTTNWRYNYSKADISGLSSFLLDEDFGSCLASSDVEAVWSVIKAIIRRGLDQFVPHSRVKSRSFPHWYTPSIIHCCNQLESLWRSVRPNSYSKRVRIQSLSNKLSDMIEEAKAAYEKSLVNGNDVSRVFKHIHGVTQSQSIPGVMYLNDVSATTDASIADLFNTYFHSVFTHGDCPLPSLNDISFPTEVLGQVAFTVSEVYEVLLSLDPNKAMGIDKIGPRVLKACATALAPALCHLFNLSVNYATLPSEWLVHVVVPQAIKVRCLTTGQSHSSVRLQRCWNA